MNEAFKPDPDATAFSDAGAGKTALPHLDRPLFADALIAVALIAALAIELYVFAHVQDIWLDESTQLSGISLEFREMLRWLAGADPDRLSVPGDRMPPVSYILDWSWLHLFGNSEIGFRLFHSAFVIAGASCLAAIAWRELGRWAMIVSLGVLILSPKLIQAGVEIRAYPVFFAITCAQTMVFVRLVTSPAKMDWRLLTLFASVSLLAIYTHFYGVVSSCAFFLALAISSLQRPAALVKIAVAFVVVTVGSLAVIPFVSAATQTALFVPVTATGSVADERAVVRSLSYLLKLAGDAANMVSVPAAILFFGGTMALLAAGIVAAGKRLRSGWLKPLDWLIAVVVFGILATVAASLFVRTFDVLKASYSLWLLAPLSLIVGAGVGSATGLRWWDVAGRWVATGVMLAGAGLSTSLFFDHASMFVHGPHRFVADLYDRAAGPKAIVYESGAAWGWSYIPLQYTHHGEVVQYQTSDDGGGLARAGGPGTEAFVQGIEATVEPYQVLLLADIRLRTYRDLRQCQDQPGACPELGSSAVEGALVGTGKWRRTGKERSFGLWDCQVTTLERLHN